MDFEADYFRVSSRLYRLGVLQVRQPWSRQMSAPQLTIYDVCPNVSFLLMDMALLVWFFHNNHRQNPCAFKSNIFQVEFVSLFRTPRYLLARALSVNKEVEWNRKWNVTPSGKRFVTKPYPDPPLPGRAKQRPRSCLPRLGQSSDNEEQTFLLRQMKVKSLLKNYFLERPFLED